MIDIKKQKINILNNMKKVLTLFFVFSVLFISAQTEYGSHTIIRNNESQMTGYFSIDAGLYGVDDYAVGSMGFTIASTTNKVFSFGAVGNWIIDSQGNIENVYMINDQIIYDGKIKKNIGYGGVLLEPSLLPSLPINITIPMVIGYGVVNYKFVNDIYWNREFQDIDNKQNFFIFSLGIRLQLNITKSIRLAIGPSYKATTNKNELTNHDFDLLNGFNLDLAIKLGKY